MTVLINKGDVTWNSAAVVGVVIDLLLWLLLVVVEMEDGDDNPVGNLMVGV